ncbi:MULTISPECIES: oxygen-dependent coproporphyrinogen oxidase [Candidatus Ichthyocystis]|uniref:oxygen-dependent coproporphyrinogen oxidase n=1 Tax=Candidatus Ichthyocystis TaxID=2929841 RepID=UPI000A54AE72|nr:MULTISPECIES: oxygen-dependent coproporphyrinogen oxidase [Ichthyocystis]
MLYLQNRLKCVHEYLVSLFEGIAQSIFRRDTWVREEGGGGESCVFEGSKIFEGGGINFSSVYGRFLPSSATVSRKHVEGQQFFATGVSSVLHPWNPYAPTAHMNVRLFCAYPYGTTSPLDENTCSFADGVTWWIGGGMDMTPYYGFMDDARHFHSVCKNILQPFGDLYPKFKENCDGYFFLKHRKEPRGIGGIFFDDFNCSTLESSIGLLEAVGKGFFDAYAPIVERRHVLPYSDRERDFQLYRRGRYAEFNLLWDRGTAFGLQSGGRIESILISMPPSVKWKYGYDILPSSPEEDLYTTFLKPRSWID